jgi:hypothetical protein
VRREKVKYFPPPRKELYKGSGKISRRRWRVAEKIFSPREKCVASGVLFI